MGQLNKGGVSQVRAVGSNVVTMAGGMKQAGVGSVAGKQTIVINKPGGGPGQLVAGGPGQQIIRTAGGQQIIVMTTAGGVKTVQHVTTSQAGAGNRNICCESFHTYCDRLLAPSCVMKTILARTALASQQLDRSDNGDLLPN